MKLTNQEWHTLNEALALAEATAMTIPGLPGAEHTAKARHLLMTADVTDGYKREGNSILARMAEGQRGGFAA